MIPNMRPNVFTSCSIIKTQAGHTYPAIGIVAQSTVAEQALKINKLSSLSHARQLYGEESAITCMASAVLQSIDTDIYAISVVNNADIPTAFKKLLPNKDVYCIAVDTSSYGTISVLNKSLTDNGGSDGLKLCICSASALTVSQVVAMANSINSPRVIVSAPHIYLPFTGTDISPALVAAMITKGELITSNLAGCVAAGKYHTSASLSEQDINTLLYNGITVLEKSSEGFQLIRGVTTSTKNPSNKQEQDNTYRDISVVYALDRVTSRVSLVLKDQIKITTSSQGSLGALLTSVVSELERLKKARLLADYKKPSIRLDSSDSSICLVELSVTLSQGVNQIYLSLNITL